jgi:hypothetical protein
MKKLKQYFLIIIIWMAVFFNIERLDFNQQNLINIQSEIYILGFVAVILTLLVPGLNRRPAALLLFFWAGVYFAIKLLPLDEAPLFGGIYNYLTITELVFILTLVFLAHRLAQILVEYAAATEFLSLAGIDSLVPDVKEIDVQIQSEVNRSRRFSRSMSVILVKADLNSTKIVLPSLLAEVQASFIQRYLNAKVAQIIKKDLRRMDLLAIDQKAERLVIINPETNSQDTPVILQRIKDAVDRELGIEIALSTASFPDQAYSYEDLLDVAEKNLIKFNFVVDPILSKTEEEKLVD